MSPRRLATVPHTAPRAVIYVRQSVTRDDSVSLELQETACRDHCTRHGYQVVAVEADPGISGRTFNRPAVTRVMEMVSGGDVDVIVLWKWSRLSRRRLDWAVAVDKVESLGGRIESSTEPVDATTASGRLARGMLAEFAAFESERIGEEWKRAQARRISRGLPASGRGRFGYRKEGRGDAQRYVPDDETAPWLRWMYEQIAGGHTAGIRGLAHELNRRGVPNQHGRTWSNSSVGSVLDSGFGAGLLAVGKGEQRTYRPGAHEAVVDEATWNAYRAARARLATTPPRTIAPTYVLSGLIRCGDCGWAMNAVPSSAKTTGYQYLCSRWRTKRDVRCVTVVRSVAEKAVLDWLAGVAGDVDAAAAADRSVKKMTTRARTDAKAAAREVAELDRQLAELTRQFIAGVVPQSAYTTARDELVAEHQAATQRLADAEHAATTKPPPTARTARALLADWDLLAVADRRQILSALIARVEVHPAVAPSRRSTVLVVPRWEA